MTFLFCPVFATELLSNTSFESNWNSWTTGTWHGTAAFSIESTGALDGSKCAKVVVSSGDATIYQEVDVTAGTYYRAKVCLRTSGLSGTGVTGIEIKTNDASYYLCGRDFDDADTWTEVSARIYSGSATKINVVCMTEMYNAYGTGEAYFDKISLVPDEIQSSSTYTLSFYEKSPSKQGFRINGVDVDPRILTVPYSTTLAKLTEYNRKDGFNMFQVVIDDNDWNNATLKTFLGNCATLAVPVILELGADSYWNTYLAATSSRNMPFSTEYTTGGYVHHFPDYVDTTTRKEHQKRTTGTINGYKAYMNAPIVAVSLGAYDAYHIPDGETHIWWEVTHPHPRGEGNQTWLPYGTDVQNAYRTWLQDNSYTTAQLGYPAGTAWSSVTAPCSDADWRTTEHWRSWILYRRAYVDKWIKDTADLVTTVPVTMTYDINFSLNDNYASPLKGLYSDGLDFVILYYWGIGDVGFGRIPSLCEMGNYDFSKGDFPTITMFEFSSQLGDAVDVEDYIAASNPYVGGFHFQYADFEGANLAKYEGFMRAVGNIEANEEWDDTPPTATVAVLISPNDYYVWDKGADAGETLYQILNKAWDVIYSTDDLTTSYSTCYVPSGQSWLENDANSAADLASYGSSGGKVVTSLYDNDVTASDINIFNMEIGDVVTNSWIGGGGEGSQTIARSTTQKHAGSYSTKWDYTLPVDPSGDYPLIELEAGYGNWGDDITSFGIYVYPDLTGPKTYWTFTAELMNPYPASANLGCYNAGATGITNDTWNYISWSLSGVDVSDVSHIRLYYHAGDSWDAVDESGHVIIYVDDITLDK